MARLQIVASTTIIWVAIATIAILVNLVPEFKYTDNIFTLMEFNAFCIVLTLMGGIGLVFLIDPNIYNGFKMKGCLEWVIGKSKIFGYMLRGLLSMTAVLVVLSPAIGGIIFSTMTTQTVVISGGVRNDGRCGPEFPLEDGSPATCDPDTPDFCCSSLGWCSGMEEDCTCETCVNYNGE